MSNTIIELRHSYVTGNVPSSLANGEIAINTYDGKLFYRGGPSNTIQTIERYQGPAGLNQEIQFNDSGVLGSSANLKFNKSSGLFSTKQIHVTNSDGDEGGEILLAKAVTNTSLTGTGITIDSFQNKIRFFEQGGSARGAYIDLTECVGGAGTNLLNPTSTPDSIARNTANAAFIAANSAGVAANTPSHVANSASIYANGAFAAANSAGSYANGAFARANNSLNANTGGTVTGDLTIGTGTGGVIAGANVIYSNVFVANSGGYVQFADGSRQFTANAGSDQYARDTANAAFVTANNEAGVNLTQNTTIEASFSHANSAFNTANNEAGVNATQNNTITASFTAANSAGIYANGAFNRANNSLDANTGGTITGDLSITGNLSVLGNTFTVSSTTIVANDTILVLGANNYTSDLLDIGFVAHYNDGVNAHVGFIRDHGTKEWQLFEGYVPEIGANNQINILDPSFKVATLNANLHSTKILVKGIDLLPYVNNAFELANTAAIAANTPSHVANSASIYANGAFIAANSASSYANSAFIHANAAFNKANTGGALTVSLTDDSNNFTNVVTSVTGIRFDANSGFDITDLGSGNVKVGMNSTFKTWKITGQQDLIANGLDTIEFVGSNGVVLTSNTLASPKTIIFDTSSVFNKANAAFTVANNANTVYVSDSPPSSPVANTLWWQSNTATLKIYYNDGITSQWVDAIQTYALDTIARNTGNAAFIAANSAGSYANSAFIHANAAFNAANSAADTWVRNQANAAFEAANSAAIYANGAFIAANSAGSYANSAFAVANNEVGVNFYQNTTIEAAFSHANSAFNTANNEAGVNATQNNTITAAFITANSADVYANGAFNRANNSINANTGGSITGDLFISGNLTVTGETTYTNTSTLLVNDNIITVNNGINQSGQPLINAGLEVNRGAQPNSSILWIETSGKWAANNGNTQYFLASDAAESYANAAFLAANTADDKATSAGIYANGAFQSANSAGVYANSAYVHANAGFVIANDAFFFANVGIQDANTAHNKANAAFIRANASFTIANGTIAWNTANAAFLAANNEAGVNATQNTNISFAWNHANAAFLQANTGGSGVKIDVYNANTNVFTGTANGTGTTFALGFTPNSSNNIIVSANGVVQYDYSLAGSTLILNFTPTIGTLIRVQSFGSSQANSLNGIFQTGNLIVYDGNTLVSLANTNTPGTFGNSTHIPVITTDSYGRITGVVNTTIGISGEDQYARNTANAAFNAANNEAGVNATQNTNITFAANHANAAFDSANTKTYTYVQSVVPATANVAGALWQNTSSGIVYMNFGNTSNPVWAEL